MMERCVGNEECGAAAVALVSPCPLPVVAAACDGVLLCRATMNLLLPSRAVGNIRIRQEYTAYATKQKVVVYQRGCTLHRRFI